MSDYEHIYSVCTHLLKQTEAGKRKIRLIGVGISSIERKNSGQMKQLELDFDR